MTEYRNPKPTADIIIEVENKIVLIQRLNPPLGYAIPGGFIDEGESAEAAAVREAKEETSLDVRLNDLLYVYSHPSRDPRLHTITIVYIASASKLPVAGDDAASVLLVDPNELPNKDEFAFDHRLILDDYIHFKKTGKRPVPTDIVKRYGS